MTKAAVPRAVVRLSKSVSLIVPKSDSASWLLMSTEGVCLTLTAPMRGKLLTELLAEEMRGMEADAAHAAEETAAEESQATGGEPVSG